MAEIFWGKIFEEIFVGKIFGSNYLGAPNLSPSDSTILGFFGKTGGRRMVARGGLREQAFSRIAANHWHPVPPCETGPQGGGSMVQRKILKKREKLKITKKACAMPKRSVEDQCSPPRFCIFSVFWIFLASFGFFWVFGLFGPFLAFFVLF